MAHYGSGEAMIELASRLSDRSEIPPPLGHDTTVDEVIKWMEEQMDTLLWQVHYSSAPETLDWAERLVRSQWLGGRHDTDTLRCGMVVTADFLIDDRKRFLVRFVLTAVVDLEETSSSMGQSSGDLSRIKQWEKICTRATAIAKIKELFELSPQKSSEAVSRIEHFKGDRLTTRDALRELKLHALTYYYLAPTFQAESQLDFDSDERSRFATSW
jgi:hypothetical protein